MDKPAFFNNFQFDKSTLSVRHLHEPDNTKQTWLSRTPQDRLLALEYLRYHGYGYDPFTDSIPRILEIVQRSEG